MKNVTWKIMKNVTCPKMKNVTGLNLAATKRKTNGGAHLKVKVVKKSPKKVVVS